MSVRPYVRPSTKSVFPIWTKVEVDDTRRLYAYNPIQGQGHGSPKVAKMADFKLSPPPVIRYTCNQKINGDYDTPRQYINLKF